MKITIRLAALATLLLTSPAMAQTELRITHATTGGTEKEVLDTIVADFEAANPDIKVKQIPFDDDIYSDTGPDHAAAGAADVPDIYFQWAGFPVAARRRGRLRHGPDRGARLGRLGRHLRAVGLDRRAPARCGEGKPYLIPISLDVTNTIWYNDDDLRGERPHARRRPGTSSSM